MNAPARPLLMTDDEFDAFVAKGAAAALGRVELREGALVRLSPQHLLHGRAKIAIFKQIDAAIDRARLALEVAMEVTVRFGSGFHPLPDLAIWAGGVARGPIPGATVKLVIEVADETLADDLGPKRVEYARARLPEYWVLDVNARALHCFHTPSAETYMHAAIVREGERVESVAVPGIAFALTLPT
jgi:Uma2 family endonuclease